MQAKVRLFSYNTLIYIRYKEKAATNNATALNPHVD